MIYKSMCKFFHLEYFEESAYIKKKMQSCYKELNERDCSSLIVDSKGMWMGLAGIRLLWDFISPIAHRKMCFTLLVTTIFCVVISMEIKKSIGRLPSVSCETRKNQIHIMQNLCSIYNRWFWCLVCKASSRPGCGYWILSMPCYPGHARKSVLFSIWEVLLNTQEFFIFLPPILYCGVKQYPWCWIWSLSELLQQSSTFCSDHLLPGWKKLVVPLHIFHLSLALFTKVSYFLSVYSCKGPWTERRKENGKEAALGF